MAIGQNVKDLIEAAWVDGHVCLVGTAGEDGPNISAKGSMIFFDDDHLAYWERSKRKALENLGRNKRVVVVYSNMHAQREGRMESPVLRFYGTAEIHETGPMKEAIFSKLLKREQEHDGADKGIGVLIKIERAETIGGKSIR